MNKPRSAGKPQVSAPTSRGAELFRLAAGTLSAKAARLGVTLATASRWASGHRLPDAEARAKIEGVLGIPADAWDRPPGDDAARPVLPVHSPAAAPSSSQRVSTLTKIDALATQLETELTGRLAPAARARVSDSLARSLAIRARIESDQALLEGELVTRSPWFRRATAALVEALRPHPAAGRAVVEALAAVEIAIGEDRR